MAGDPGWLAASLLVPTDAQWLAEWLGLPRGGTRPVRVASPCVGVDSPARAAMALKFPWVSVLVYDIEPELLPALRALHGADHSKMRIGRRCGDVTRLSSDLIARHLGQHGFQECDGLVSGFPCPPYSSIGSRKLASDPRSLVCTAVVNMICWLAKNHRLMWFVLENVPGITKRKHGDEESFADWLMRYILEQLNKEAVTGWDCKLKPHTAAHCSLVQHRARVFFVGTSPLLREMPIQRALLNTPVPERPKASLRTILSPTRADEDFVSTTCGQQMNVLMQLQALDKMADVDQKFGDIIAIADISRDPSKEAGVDSDLKIDRCATFRTNNRFLWLIPGRNLRSTYGEHGRYLSRDEKCLASGIAPGSLRELSLHRLEVALGNTIPPPLVGDILAPVLSAWTLAMRQLQERDWLHENGTQARHNSGGGSGSEQDAGA
jgi:site-specific DNA-cytosine methylase